MSNIKRFIDILVMALILSLFAILVLYGVAKCATVDALNIIIEMAKSNPLKFTLISAPVVFSFNLLMAIIYCLLVSSLSPKQEEVSKKTSNKKKASTKKSN